MKRIFALLVSISLMMLCLPFTVLADSDIKITLNGTPIDCASYGQEAAIVEGRTLVPLRAIFEALGASVEWNQSTKTVTSTLGDTTIRLTIGEKTLYKNSESVEIDVPATIMNGRTMVPARAVAESFGVSVGWSAKKRTVVLMTVPNEPMAKYNADIENRLAEFVPKSALDNEILGTVGKIPVSGAAVRYMTMVKQSYIGYGISDDESAKMAEEVCHENAGLISFAYKNNITLTDEELERVVDETLLSLEFSYGDLLDEALAEAPYTLYYYCLYSIYSALYEKVTDAVLNDADSEFMSQVRDEVMDYLVENDYVRAKHILVMFPEGEGENGNVTDEQRIETLVKANDILREVKAMSDISEFDAFVEKYNEDPGMESNPGGYYFTKNEMVKPFEDATYSLKEGEISGIVETDYGFHIILRLPLEDESLYESSVYYNFLSDRILNLIDMEGASMEMVYAENYDERVEDFEKEYNDIYA